MDSKKVKSSQETAENSSSTRPKRFHKVMFSVGWCVLSIISLPRQASAGVPIAATPSAQIGDTVTNPVTGVDATVIQLIKDSNGVTDIVVTSNGDLIQTKTVVGDTIQPVGGTAIYKVISVVTNATTGLVQTTNIRLTTAAASDPTTAQAVTTNASAAFDDEAALNKGTPGTPEVVPAQSTSGIINEVSKGKNGDNGDDGYGVRICAPDWLGGGCASIEYPGSDGDNGGAGLTVNRIVTVSHGPIGSTNLATNGITLGSIGGDGGNGGSYYGVNNHYDGGQGADGGQVILNNATTVSTTKGKSQGIYAFSRSGTGGRGGATYGIGNGGSGGAARDGGDVSVKNTGEIDTLGNESHGIYVLSVGGAAGNGGGSWGIVGEGGSGANGGNGGNVSVDNNALIHTTGIGSHGILGQSIGGTGGNGGAAGGIVAFGGNASTGGVGGNVNITNRGNADIQTTGRGSIGVFGQSIGGGGGDSGAAGGIVALGATGGTGNNAGTVTITNQAGSRITTGGQDSHGVFAQSVGGGGGNSSPTGGAVSIGGSGAGGGNGSTIALNNSAIIDTAGKNAHGIFAQSIGGGGGSAGGNGGLVALGGNGAAGGNGKGVTVTNNLEGLVSTTGIGSHAIFAQSIGGGGGAGGDSGGLVSIGGKGSGGGSGSTVAVTNSGVLKTAAKDAKGIFAQSIGGGGGSGGGSGGLVALGGAGSTGSNANTVTIVNNTTAGIFTKGDGSDTIFAQSIGGGGGAGAGSGGLIALGGSGSGGGSGGSVSVTNAGFLSTQGVQARGIFAQSIGGGGGSGGSSGGLVAIGGSGSNASNAGNIAVVNSGNINTLSDKSTAIFAQSVGGGGGDGGNSGGPIAIGGSGGSGGDAGTVTVTHGGQIFTHGNDALGVFAQAVGGGGGNGGSAYSGSLFAGLALGGSGSQGGDGSAATVTLNEFDLLGLLTPSIISTTGDRSTGILAQSVGGGGGNGGNAIQGTVGVGSSISVALGGTGGAGGTGGTVNLSGKGNVITGGNNASGVVLQSVGGGGGNGGSTVSGALSIADGVGISVAVGGKGGNGGNGGVVTANVDSVIQTDGELSSGFVAQSVGGGGGNGGTTVSATGAAGLIGAAAISVAVGGNAGSGGKGEHVDATLGGSVLTKQAQSDAVVIQSVGGGGGNGGVTVAAGAAGAVGGSANVTVGVGGGGGNGGAAGRIDAHLTNNVETLGDGSDGVIVQSIGGGGGNSGLTVSAGLSGAGVGAGGINIGVGGSGGLGGSGDIVDANYAGNLITRGDNATGLLAQSVGGGGGNSSGTIAGSLNGAGTGSGSIAVGIGGNGGGAGNGGRSDTSVAVTLGTSGKVKTFGNRSAGVVAQSVGGGGGNGGYSIAASFSGAGVGSGAVSVGVGGGAGSGGHGKGVVADLKSDIWTEGTESIGALIQSVGGGGGNGGFNVSGSLSGAGVGSGGISIGLGGTGGSGGLGGDVNASSSGIISTLNDRSSAFVAQSIGGGGGNGGFNVSGSLSGAGTGSGAINVGLGGSGGSGNNASTVIANVSGKTATYGAQSTGILAQSVGGGGGNGGFNITAGASGAGVGSGAVSVGLGGIGAAGGNGGAVTLNVTETVYTEEKQSGAVIAQSIGGGGGNGGYNVSAVASGAGTGSGTVSVGLGGSSGSGGNAGAVVASTQGDILTLGDLSGGVLAQSVGGGGGNGGFNIAVSGSGAGTGSGAVGVGLGGSGSGGGNASTVELTVANNVTTQGKNSAGIVAQSVGGGGGNGGFDVTVSGSGAGTGSGAVSVGLGGSAGGGGNASDVSSSVTGDVVTSGDYSTGLLLQSVGGGGGNGGFDVTAAISGAGTGSGSAAVGLGGSGGAGGVSGAVLSTLVGNVNTDAKNATAVIAQSIGGGGGNGGMAVAGAISGAGTGSAGASVSIGGSGGGGGNSNTVNNTVAGHIVTAAASSGGVLAQSVGGGGGNGGISINGSISVAGTGSGAVSVGIGGSGGDGGDADKVTNAVAGTVYTSDLDAFGIVAQSLGGGGGNGGINVAGTIAAAKTGAGALAIGIGGTGGGGGSAADVDNTVTGYVQTLGDNATGILAQSLGGGGGNGGLNVTGTITAANTGSGGLAVGVGGFGGEGGDGKEVLNTVTGGTVTAGNNSDAIVAQSLGGGGGNGAINVSGAINLTKENGGTLGVGIGGFGGSGGNGSNVTSTVTTTAEYNQIGTKGNNSSAVVAQSIGGGGGNGGVNVTGAVNLTGKNGAAVGVGVGGFGGGAGNAGNVLLDVAGQISTEGNDSQGLLAQSIGGGGGNGGTNVTGSLALSNSTGGSSKAVAASIGVGGFGGDGGNAGNVDVTYAGTIVAVPKVLIPEKVDVITGVVTPEHYEIKDGTGSHGIAAQSIGGGGGNGGVNVSEGISYAAGKGDGYGLVVGFGGFGGGGGDAGNVDVKVTGGESIFGYGAEHSAILAQSVGGGGGNGALNVSGGIVSDSPLIVGVGGFGADAGVAKNVKVDVAADVAAGALDSKDLSSAGIMAQSLGGGGGNGGMNISGGLAINKESSVPSLTVGIGGFGGAGSSSGDVTVNQMGNAITSGNWIHGIMAQSIAGGGGNGGLNVSGEINFADSTNSGGKTDLSVVAGIGGNGGKGADAGNVSVTHAGIVTTDGDNARGVAAQSIGGGGGTGGMNVTGVFAQNSSPINVGVGGSGSGGGHAGSVAVNRGTATTSTGKVTTDGNGAYGIEASSIGGGGGDAGMNFNVGVSLAGRNNTPAGFAAQFVIGGAGGEAGNGSTSQVNNFSDIETKQDNSHGILAQSIGGGGGNANFNLAATYEGASGSGGLYNKPNKNMGFSLAVGGAPGDGGSGDEVDVVHSGNIETYGNTSFGILSQSIGGGGGNAGMDVAFIQGDGGKMGITLGRVGGTGGFGSDVTLSSKGSVITHGDGSFGMLAQSIGNGGGNSSATSVAGEIPSKESNTGETTPQAVGVSIGLEGGEGGRAGNVTLDAAGWVSTIGKNAHAIFAQSVGGGGGNGGLANTAGPSAKTAALSLGGIGGKGGIGGTVAVTSSADVRTNNSDSVGILAQSIGGGGGSGGMAFTGGESKVDGVTVAVGGNGGIGMAGGIVTVDNSGVIITDGDGSHGVLAQSLGGGGGNSGMVINSIMTDAAKDPSKRVAISVGGVGGDGAIASDVTVTNTGGIGTTKDNSIGIFAQSIGGGGGNAKNVITNVVSGEGGGNSLSMGIGGTGGTGASAGNVSVSNLKSTAINSGKIITEGNYSHGILAMSVGGGGGTGSTTMSTKKAATASSTSTTNSFALSLGGDGGDGGTGGNIDVTNGGEITTYGYKAHGILAQSVGGGGGNGGMAITGDLDLDLGFGSKTTDSSSDKSGSFALGGFGGNGNTSGDVTVNNSGSIEVFGNSSNGIFAQSVGGGGGDGGFAATLSRNILSYTKTDLNKSLMNLGVGGNGGDGSDSGNVLVQHTGTITSHGDNSYGIFAQSVSGGGGNFGHSLISPTWMAADLAVSTLLGGRDGSKGTAGTVTINTTGNIVMLGKNSLAQLGQSVNGGGGNVDTFLDVSKHAVALGDDGFELPDNSGDVDKTKAFVKSIITLGTTTVANAAGSAIDATHIGDLYTAGKNSLASLMQSIGGGGGNANSEIVVDSTAHVDLELALGGASSSNNNGGDVTLNRTGNIATTGDQSAAAGVQSIGGGGGNLTVNVVKVPDVSSQSALAISDANILAPIAFSALDAVIPGVTGTAMLGADGGTSSNGGDINMASSGDVITTGVHAYGLMYQSIGGGGGKLDLTGFDNLQISVGGTNGSSGNGGDITLTNTGAITTIGELSNGISIQSIGGGGGAAFTDLDPSQIALTLNTRNSGNGGNISFNQIGDIVVNGDRSIGVFAQSLGGGGGSVDRLFADTAGGAGVSGAVNLSLDSNVVADGQDGVAVFAQSRGTDGQGDINITLAKDKVLYAGKNGVGVWMSGGANNNFTNHGDISTEDGVLGWAAKADSGNNVIDNYGTIYGQFDLAGTGINQVVNHKDYKFVSGANLLLGDASNQLINDGTLMPGDRYQSLESYLSGSFLQSSTGKSFFDLDLASGKADAIRATGTANIDGIVDVAFFNEELVKPGHVKKILYSGDMGLTDNGISLITHGTSIITYDPLIITPTMASLSYSVDFSPNGLNSNQTAFGDYINALQLAGGSAYLRPLVGTLFRIENPQALQQAYNMLTPEAYSTSLATTLASTKDFNNSLMSCRERGGNYRFVSQGECGWMRVAGRSTRYDNTFQNLGYTEDAIQVAGGVQKSIGENTHIGFGASYEDSSSQVQNLASIQGQRAQGGLVVKGRSNATTVTGSVIGGYGWFDTKRTVNIANLGGTAKATQELSFVSGHLQIARIFEYSDIYLRPMLEPSIINLHQYGVTESGGGLGNLAINARDDLYAAITPSLEIGSELSIGSGSNLLRPRIKLSVTQYVGDSSPTVVANLVGTPTGVASFAANAGMDETLGNVEAGFDLITRHGVTVRMDGLAQFGKNTEVFQGSLKITIPF